MAIEVGIFHNGAADLPTALHDGLVVPRGSLEEVSDSYARVQVNQIRQGVLADELGFDYYFMTEHHFQPEGAEFSPNPLVAEMAIAALTKRIRLGQATNVLTEHHPVRLAEQGAMLDIISGGRMEFGVGRGYQPREVEVLGAALGASVQDGERNRQFFEEAYEVLLKCWTEESFSHQGEFFSLPPRYTRWHHRQTMAYFDSRPEGPATEDVLNLAGFDRGGVLSAKGSSSINSYETTMRELQVYPKPLQKPYPQIWQPLTSPRSVEFAAAHGINGYFNASPVKRLKQDLEFYYSVAERLDWPDRLDRGQFAYGWDSARRRGVITDRQIHIVGDGIGDMDRAARGVEAQWDFYGAFGFSGALNEPDEPPIPNDMRVTADLLRSKDVAIHGTADFVIEKILELKQGAGYGEDFMLNCHFEMAGFEGSEIEDQMRCFAERVLPELAKECGGRVQRESTDVALVP
jgi:alkanesulfonate monooxygenase SsuD/methylene tetrahydromethanopterin reductase-like flavin-dependent oxidoreductase (luciferase family)